MSSPLPSLPLPWLLSFSACVLFVVLFPGPVRTALCRKRGTGRRGGDDPPARPLLRPLPRRLLLFAVLLTLGIQLSSLLSVSDDTGFCADAAWQASFNDAFAATTNVNTRFPNHPRVSWAPLLSSSGYMRAADFVCVPGSCDPLRTLLKRWKVGWDGGSPWCVRAANRVSPD